MKRTVSGLVFLGVFVLMTMNAFAVDSMQCRRYNIIKTVSKGDSEWDIKMKCGYPVSREWVLDGDYGVVHRWTYNFGPCRIVHFVKLQKGQVVKIEMGNLGY